MKVSSEIEQFTQNTVHLNNPGEEDINNAYLRLPARGRISITCPIGGVGATMICMEKVGFFALMLIVPNRLQPTAQVWAFKGKEGACHDTGRTVSYRGVALAVLDDDGHLIEGSTPVCEKTARLYVLPVYRDFLVISQPDKSLYHRLFIDPKPFDCDNFESAAASLAKRLKGPTGSSCEAVPVMYPGPFRIIILKDGSMLRRGQITLLHSEQARLLKASKEALMLDGQDFASSDLSSARDFLTSYQIRGSLCLKDAWWVDGTPILKETLDFQALGRVNKTTQRRIGKLIARRQSYFILTGSDPRDEYGCCPSDDVGSSNRLVEAGLLHFLAWPAPPGTCPTTIYAFAGEIEQKDGRPIFSINDELRKQVQNHLESSKKGKITLLKNVLRVVLLLFVGMALAYPLWQKPKRPGDAALRNTQTRAPMINGVGIYFFHTSVRCNPCLNMEAFTQQTLGDHFSEQMKDNTLQYKKINIDDARYRHLIDRYSIFTSTIVLVRFREGKEKNFESLTAQVWQLYNSEQQFVSMLKQELSRFMSDGRE